VECSGRQPGTTPAGEKSSPKAADEEQGDMLKQQKEERLRSPNNEWEMPVLQEGYARA